MKRYIFYTCEGFSQTPLGEDIENMQVLGFAEGTSVEIAKLDLLQKNPWIVGKGYAEKRVLCRELA